MLFEKFPREVGPPRKLVHNKEEYLAYINNNNGKKKAVYTSIYTFETLCYNPYIKPLYESAVVDKIYYDFDDKSCNAYEECLKLHEECDKEDIKHMIIFSGRGYHLYIFTKPKLINYKKEAIRGGQEYFINKLKLLVDKQVIGNVAQLARIPNTFNIKAKRFCIPLIRDEFMKGDLYVKGIAKEQHFVKDVVMCRKLFDISPWDKESPKDFNIKMTKNAKACDISLGNIKDIPPCLDTLMCNDDMKWKERYLVILYFKEKGYLKEEVFEVLKKCLSPKKLNHCVKEERQLQYLFNRDDLMFPSCEKLKEEGFCTGKCLFFNCVVYK